MTYFLHGLVPPAGAELGRLKFGSVALAGFIWTSQLPFSDRPLRPWPFRKLDRRFTHFQGAGRELVWKLERVAAQYAARQATFATAVLDCQPTADHPSDLSIALDSVIVYFRVLADAIAALTSYLYPSSAGDIPYRSFRNHRKWFRDTNSALDPAYTAMLSDETEWFEVLAGKKGRGIRDLLIHDFGQFQHPVVTDPPSLRGRVSADLVTGTSYIGSVENRLKVAMTGFCRFLDLYTVHHAARIEAAAGWSIFDPRLTHAGDIFHFNQLPESRWLFPVQQDTPSLTY